MLRAVPSRFVACGARFEASLGGAAAAASPRCMKVAGSTQRLYQGVCGRFLGRPSRLPIITSSGLRSHCSPAGLRIAPCGAGCPPEPSAVSELLAPLASQRRPALPRRIKPAKQSRSAARKAFGVCLNTPQPGRTACRRSQLRSRHCGLTGRTACLSDAYRGCPRRPDRCRAAAVESDDGPPLGLLPEGPVIGTLQDR